jgi:hypothetical protein
MNLFEMFDSTEPNEPVLIAALRDFLPVAVDHLDLDHIPKIHLVKELHDTHVPTFGRFVNDEQVIYVVVDNRNTVDVLRTLAHELVHYKQGEEHRLEADSWHTGSPIEDEANAEGGVIMRLFNQKFPAYMSSEAIDLSETVVAEKRKRKKKSKRRAYSSGYYGYYYGGTNNDGEADGGGDGGESMYEGIGKSALVAALTAALALPAQAEPTADALGIVRQINRYKQYGQAGWEAEANQELMNILRSIQGHPNQSKLLPIITDIVKSSDSDAEQTLPPLTLDN